MKSTLFLRALALGVAVFGAETLLAQAPATADRSADQSQSPVAMSRTRVPRVIPRGTRFVPESSLEKPGDAGVRSHTNHVLFITEEAALGPQGETPQSIREVYGLPSTGGSGVIAIIDAYHYPTSLNDFNVFARQFGLPVETSTDATRASNKVFQVVYASGRQPATNKSWSQEAALDIEWAHAMAPNAKIVLVEAASSSNGDLNTAVRAANGLPGIAEVSMSYGSSESRNETNGEASLYTKAFVVYVAASGDVGGVVNYPGCSVNVVAAGGTSINRDDNGDFVSETGWSGSGGGLSRFIARPSYQKGISNIVGNSRGVPDLSFDADPSTGVSVYDSTPFQGSSGWMVFGGTSVSTPALAGIINTAATSRKSFAKSTVVELTTIYSQLGTAAYSSEFRDVSQGSAGKNHSGVDWDLVTGVGSPLGLNGK